MESSRNDFYEKVEKLFAPQRVETGTCLRDIVALWLPSEGLHVGLAIRIFDHLPLKSNFPVFEWRFDSQRSEKLLYVFEYLPFWRKILFFSSFCCRVRPFFLAPLSKNEQSYILGCIPSSFSFLLFSRSLLSSLFLCSSAANVANPLKYLSGPHCLAILVNCVTLILPPTFKIERTWHRRKLLMASNFQATQLIQREREAARETHNSTACLISSATTIASNACQPNTGPSGNFFRNSAGHLSTGSRSELTPNCETDNPPFFKGAGFSRDWWRFIVSPKAFSRRIGNCSLQLWRGEGKNHSFALAHTFYIWPDQHLYGQHNLFLCDCCTYVN